MKKKFFLTLAILMVLTCIFAVSVSAAEPSYADGEWIYAADGVTKLAIRDTDGNPLIWYMNGEELKYVRADQTDDSLDVYVKYSISAGGSGFDSAHTPTACLKDVDIYDNGTQIEGATINSQIVLFNMEKLEIDALNGWLFGNKNGCCTIMRGIVFPTTLKYIGVEGFTSHRIVQMWNLENTQFEWYNTSNSEPFSNRYLTQEATNYTLKFPPTLTMNPSVQYTLVKTVIFSPNSTIGNANQTLREMPNLEKVYIGTGFYETSFNGEGIRGTTNFLMFFTGTEEQALALKENAANSGGHNNHFKDDRTQIISYETYISDPATYDNATNKIYIIYGCNYCDAFYDSVHQDVKLYENSTCQGKCEACGMENAPSKNPEHKLAYVFSNENGNTLSYTEIIVVKNTCSSCGAVDSTDTIDPLFIINGYSHATDAIMQAFQINKDAIEKYMTLSGKDVKYGILAASGNVANIYQGVFTDNVISVDFTNRSYDIMEMKIYGIGEAHYETELYCCGYILVDGEIIYMDDGMAEGAIAPSKVTYNSIANKAVVPTTPEATVTNKEDEVA